MNFYFVIYQHFDIMKNKKCGCTKKGEEVYPTELVEGHVHKIRCVSVYILWQSTDINF